jgi:hypothetical protein
LAAFIEIFYCTTNVACYNCGPQPNQVIQFTPGRQKSLSVARVGFAISKMRRRFGAGFMIGVDGLNVPAPAQFWRSSKEELRNGIQPKLQESASGQSQSATGQYAKAVKREKAHHGPEVECRTIYFKYKQVLSHSPRKSLECQAHGPGPASFSFVRMGVETE